MPSPKRKILYVDDDVDARLMLTLLFGQQGYEVTAASGLQAVQFIDSEESFNLYILGSGADSAAFRRKIREADGHTPTIMYAGASGESNKEEALRTGGSVFIAKQRIEKLLDMVKAELDF